MNGILFPVKFCGLTNLKDIKKALDCKVGYLGFIFYPKSPRGISLEEFESFVNELKKTEINSKLVAVTKNADLKYIIKILKLFKFDYIQLHGQENLELIKQLKASFPTIKIWKALEVNDTNLFFKIESYKNLVQAFVIDLPKEEDYSKPKTVHKNFELLKKLIQNYPIVLAGGINEINVSKILAKLDNAKPLAIDVASGIEISYKKKSLTKMRNLVTIIKKEYETNSKF